MVQRRRSRGPSGQSNRQETINNSRVATISTQGLSALPTRGQRGASAEDRFLAACKTLASQPFLGALGSSRISPPRQALSVLVVSPQPAAIRWPSACAKKLHNLKKAARRKNARAAAPAVPHAAADRPDQELHAADADAPSEKTVANVQPHTIFQDAVPMGTDDLSSENEHKTDVDDGARVPALGRELYQVDPLRAVLRAGPGEEY